MTSGLAAIVIALFIVTIFFAVIYAPKSSENYAHNSSKKVKLKTKSLTLKFMPRYGKQKYKPIDVTEAAHIDRKNKTNPSNRPKVELPNTPPKRAAKSLHHFKLVKLVSNDEAIANRLVSNIRAKYPDKSLDWCYEKVIDDLLRDRN